jgi:hypothetical protein
MGKAQKQARYMEGACSTRSSSSCNISAAIQHSRHSAAAAATVLLLLLWLQ